VVQFKALGGKHKTIKEPEESPAAFGVKRGKTVLGQKGEIHHPLQEEGEELGNFTE